MGSGATRSPPHRKTLDTQCVVCHDEDVQKIPPGKEKHMRTVEVTFGKKQLTLDVDDKGQATLFETIVRYNSRRDALVEALRRVARHAEQEATAMESGYQVSGLGVFQSETTIVDARAGELGATHEAILALASAIGFEL